MLQGAISFVRNQLGLSRVAEGGAEGASVVITVLDTDFFLHFESPQNIPWRNRLDSDEVILVVCHTVVEELDRHKDDASTSRKRNRARKALNLIWSAGNDGETEDLPDGVTLNYYEDPQDADYHAYGLDPDNRDDRIVAFALDLQASTEADVRLASGDIGPRLKARRRSLSVVEWLDGYRVETLSPEAKKNRELRRQLEEYESASPDLSLVFVGTDGESTVRILDVEQVEEFDEDAAEEKLDKLRKQYPPESRGKGDSVASGLLQIQVAQISPEEYERYEEDRQRYFEEYEKHLRMQYDLRVLRRRSSRIEVQVRNDGKVPAKNIEVTLRVPDGPVVLGESDFPTGEPEEPDPPTLPRTRLERSMLSSVRPGYLDGLADLYTGPSSLTIGGDAGGWDISEDNSYTLTREIQQVRQNRGTTLPPFWVMIPEDFEPTGFSIEYLILADEVPGETIGDLQCVIPSESAD